MRTAAAIVSRFENPEPEVVLRLVRGAVREAMEVDSRTDVDVRSAVESALRKFRRETRTKREPPAVPEAGEFIFRPGQLGRWSDRGLVHVRLTRAANGETVEEVAPVIPGAVRPLRRVRVEERTYVEAEIGPDERVTLQVPDLVSRLDRDGRLVYHDRARDLVPSWLQYVLPRVEVSYPTWGFYADTEGRIVEARPPTPVLPEQATAWGEVRDAVERPASAEDIAAYVRLLPFFRPREILPVLGSAVAAPFAHLLRSRHLLVKHVYLWSKVHGLGKTSGAEAFSDGLYGRNATTGGSLNSEFRMPAHLDAYLRPADRQRVRAPGMEETRRGPQGVGGGTSRDATRQGGPHHDRLPFPRGLPDDVKRGASAHGDGARPSPARPHGRGERTGPDGAVARLRGGRV